MDQHMKITITIETENDAFQDGQLSHEVANILEILRHNDFTFPRSCKIWDTNGNVCGKIKIEEVI